MSLATNTNAEMLRRKTVEAAKLHKVSWIELGQLLYTVQKDKLYRDWGFLSFEIYCERELGIKQARASRMLKCYDFLEKEEPRITAPAFSQEEPPTRVPDCDSVHLLRLAKNNKKLTPRDISHLREKVIDEAREPNEIRARVKQLVAEKEDADSPEERTRRRNAALKRLVSMLSNAKSEFENERLLPGYLLKQMDELAHKLSDQIEQ